jgi:hypothetical protein
MHARSAIIALTRSTRTRQPRSSTGSGRRQGELSGRCCCRRVGRRGQGIDSSTVFESHIDAGTPCHAWATPSLPERMLARSTHPARCLPPDLSFGSFRSLCNGAHLKQRPSPRRSDWSLSRLTSSRGTAGAVSASFAHARHACIRCRLPCEYAMALTGVPLILCVGLACLPPNTRAIYVRTEQSNPLLRLCPGRRSFGGFNPGVMSVFVELLLSAPVCLWRGHAALGGSLPCRTREKEKVSSPHLASPPLRRSQARRASTAHRRYRRTAA